MTGRIVMLQPVRLILTWISLPLLLVFAAPGSAVAGARGMAELLNGRAALAALSANDLLVFGVLGVAAASAAVAVRMVRRWH